MRRQLKENRRLQRLAYKELGLARATLAARAVAMYKHRRRDAPWTPSFGAADLGDLVTQLTMVRTIARCDRDIVRTIESTKRELTDRAVNARGRRAHGGEARRHLQDRARDHPLVASTSAARRWPACAPTSAAWSPRPRRRRRIPRRPSSRRTQGGGGGDGAGPWWSLIQSAAASNGVSARGMYRLMMIESGGSATVVGPGGYYGLFQYAPTTWSGSWNPWRSSSITDGAAQIKATALAIRQGYGHAWWDLPTPGRSRATDAGAPLALAGSAGRAPRRQMNTPAHA